MESLIYWNGVAVGVDCGSYTSWFPSTLFDDMWTEAAAL